MEVGQGMGEEEVGVDNGLRARSSPLDKKRRRTLCATASDRKTNAEHIHAHPPPASGVWPISTNLTRLACKLYVRYSQKYSPQTRCTKDATRYTHARTTHTHARTRTHANAVSIILLFPDKHVLSFSSLRTGGTQRDAFEYTKPYEYRTQPLQVSPCCLRVVYQLLLHFWCNSDAIPSIPQHPGLPHPINPGPTGECEVRYLCERVRSVECFAHFTSRRRWPYEYSTRYPSRSSVQTSIFQNVGRYDTG